MDILTTTTHISAERPLMLFRNGHVLTCPFATKIPLMEGTISKQLRIEAQPCWELCPHFEATKIHNYEMRVELTCSGKEKVFDAIINNTTKPQENTIFPAT